MKMLTLDAMTDCGSHQQGHFLLSSGFHSADYLQCALYLAHPRRAEQAGRLIASQLTDAGLEPEIVVAPAMGGLIIGHEVARALDRPFIFTERVGADMELRRGFGIEEGQTAVIIEDVVTTGKSTREVVAKLEDRGADIIGMASMINRSPSDNPFQPIPFVTLLRIEFPTWSAAECPLCQRGEAMTRPGSRPVT